MITPELIQRFLDEPKASDPLLAEAVAVAERVQVHTLQTVPDALLDMERPHEEPSVKQYRKDIYRCPTHSAASKIISNIRKIPRAQGYKMQLPDVPRPLVREDKELNLYLTKDFPEWDSFEHYVWRHLAEQCVNDPGAIIAVYPRHLDSGQVLRDGIDYAEPFPFVFRSAEVLEYVEGERVVILKSDDKSLIGKPGEEKAEGNVILFIDREEILTLEQFGSEGKYRERWRVTHGFGVLPAWQMGGQRVLKKNKFLKLWASFLSPCLPDWEKAILRDSDEQACLIDHVAPEKWMKTTIPCPSCNGDQLGGIALNEGETAPICSTCKGSHYVPAASPYKVYVFPPTPAGTTPNEVGGNTLSGEPMGYVQKDIEAVRFISEKVTSYITKGLDAVGLAILDYVPLSQSGIAKAQDRSEADTFYYDLGMHVKEQIILPCIYFLQRWRYPMLSLEQQSEYYNAIRVEIPTTFSLLHPAYFQERVAQAKKDGENPLMIQQAELEHTQNKYGENSETYLIMRAATVLDPLPGMTADEKSLAKMNGGCTPEEYVLSTKLTNLIRRAYQKNRAFFDLEEEEQRLAVLELARESVTQANPLMPTFQANAA